MQIFSPFDKGHEVYIRGSGKEVQQEPCKEGKEPDTDLKLIDGSHLQELQEVNMHERVFFTPSFILSPADRNRKRGDAFWDT